MTRSRRGLHVLLAVSLITAPGLGAAQPMTGSAVLPTVDGLGALAVTNGPALGSGAPVAAAVVRVGNHPGFSRIVFEFAVPTGFDVAEQGERLLLVFEGAPTVPSGRTLPRNVLAIEGGPGAATIQLAPGARFRASRMGNRVIVDVMPRATGARPAASPEPAPPQTAATSSTPAVVLPATTPPTLEEPLKAEPSRTIDAPKPPSPGDLVLVPAASPPTPSATPAEPLRAPVIPVTGEPLQAGLNTAASSVRPAMLPHEAATVLLPAEAGVGAAAFRRSDDGLVVLDQPVRLDAGVLGTVLGFASATVELAQATTVFKIPLAADQELALSREAAGWRVSIAGRAASGEPPGAIRPAFKPAGLLLAADRPGRAVSVADPLTGSTLLVGTVIPAAGAGPAVVSGRRGPGYALLPTWLGVVVEPLADLIELRPIAAGFMLSAPGMLPESDTAPPAVQAFTRRFDFPDLPVPALLQRLKAQTAAAAAAPPRGRTADRLAAAQTLLSLGLATEAQAILVLIATDDPVAGASPSATGLLAISALLAGRSAEAGGLDDPRLDGTDDLALWRGVRDAMRDTDPDAGRGLPRLLPLASAYPPALRNRLRPLIVEAAVATNQAGSVAAALAASDDSSLDFARALRQERDGKTDAALQAYDALTVGRDQLTQVRAGVRAAELRLRQSMLSPTAAADKLERYAAIWRGDPREGRIRLRAAELRTMAGAYRPALDMLRDTERLFPDQQIAIRKGMAAVFQDMLTRADTVSPIELVTLASDYAALLPDGAGGGIPALLADKLVALDLPGRAGPVLDALMAAAKPGLARAVIGARLAQLQLDAGALPAALATLRSSNAPELPAELSEQRSLLMARIRAGQGDVPGAAAALLALGTAAADDLRATMLVQTADWPGSLAALSDLASKTVASEGPLTEAMMDIVLRQATSAVQANDAAALTDLRRRHATRLAGPRADLFRLLTADPLRGPADLPRAANELALARLTPDRLQRLTPRPPP